MIRIFLGLSAALAIVGSAQAATTAPFVKVQVAGRTNQAIKSDIRKAAVELCQSGPSDFRVEESDLRACIAATYEQGVSDAKRANPAAFAPAAQTFAAR